MTIWATSSNGNTVTLIALRIRIVEDAIASDIASLEPYGIEAQHPDVFLSQLFNNDPESMVEVIRQQAEALKKPPQTVAELLERLEKNNRVPSFVNKVRLYISAG